MICKKKEKNGNVSFDKKFVKRRETREKGEMD